MEFQNRNENELHGFGNLVIWLWKSSGNNCKGVCTNPVPRSLVTYAVFYECRYFLYIPVLILHNPQFRWKEICFCGTLSACMFLFHVFFIRNKLSGLSLAVSEYFVKSSL